MVFYVSQNLVDAGMSARSLIRQGMLKAVEQPVVPSQDSLGRIIKVYPYCAQKTEEESSLMIR